MGSWGGNGREGDPWKAPKEVKPAKIEVDLALDPEADDAKESAMAVGRLGHVQG